MTSPASLFRSRPGKLFMVSWILFTVPFATNIVREHYPAFSIADDLTFKVDRYLGFHADIFEHTDGHSYVGNNVIVSVIAAIPVFLTDPVLDALERMTPAPREGGFLDDSYQTDKPNRQAFFRRVTEAGLTLRFGGAALVTVVLLMAPLTALFVVLMYQVLVKRGVEEPRAVWLALLFGFGTPVFFRTLHLNHNMFLMYAIFAAFYVLWFREDGKAASPNRRFLAGLLCGFCVAADYAGAVLLLTVYAYLVLSRVPEVRFARAFKESLVFVIGSVPPVLFLLYSQWAMFGNPFLPGQYWMPAVNFTDQGWKGFSIPTLDLYWLNFFSPAYGMFTFGPILLLGLLPFRSAHPDALFGKRERVFVWALILAFLTFCAANQYSRMQFNSGFRYLAPMLPFFFLLAAERLRSWSNRNLMLLSGVLVVHSWVMATFREPVLDSWKLFFSEGATLPWLRVLRMTTSPNAPLIHHPLLPILILGGTIGFVLWFWRRTPHDFKTQAVTS